MNLLELVTNEFIQIVEHISNDSDVINDRIIIERERFRNLLSKYAFMNFREKTKVYKNLNFIIHDKNNYTMPCKDENKRTVRKVVINYKTYLTLKELKQEVK